MERIGFIPLRAGSKSILFKNRTRMLGRPLFSWVLSEAIFSNLDKVYIFTDDEWIVDYVKKNYTWSDKVEVLIRGTENSGDTSSTESAMHEFSEKINHNYDIICLLQATSPLTTRTDINEVLSKIKDENYDSVLTVVNTKRFIWDKNGKSLNYDYLERPRRQDFDGLLVENGAVYAATKKNFQDKGNRLGGNIGIVEMHEDSLTEVDEPNDLLIVEQLLRNRLKKNKKFIQDIKTFILDVDGVFTDATIEYSAQGEHAKTFNMKDGMGLELIRENNVQVFVITSEISDIVKERMKKLNIDNFYPGIKDKYAFLELLTKKHGLKRSEIAYIGDDINDMANICSSGWGFCPNDAVNEIKNHADIVLNHKGGCGAIRECIGLILNYNKRFK